MVLWGTCMCKAYLFVDTYTGASGYIRHTSRGKALFAVLQQANALGFDSSLRDIRIRRAKQYDDCAIPVGQLFNADEVKDERTGH